MRNNKFEEISLKKYREWFDSNYEQLHNRSPFHHPAWISAVARGVDFNPYIDDI